MIRVFSWLLGVGLFLGLALAPRWTVDHPYVLHMLVLMCIYAIPAVGLNLMLGYSGLVSLGHMGFAGLGSYTAAVLMVDARWSFWTALGAATLASAVAGALIGLICFRFRGHFFMIVTLAFGLLLHAVMNNWDEVTRGAAGFAGIPRPRPLQWGDEMFSFGPLPNFYYLALVLTLVVFFIQYLVVRSDLGRILSAIRQDERLARSRGVNVLMYKTVVFSLGTALAGVGGVLHVSFLRVAAPASFNMLESINTVLIVIVGGAGSLMGPALGALVYVALPEGLRLANEWRLVIFGGLLVLITLFAPTGLAGLIKTALARLQAGRREPS
jgi:branched-chain amino acid transport system permease protein